MEIQNIIIVVWAWLSGFVIGVIFSVVIGFYLYNQPKKVKKKLTN